MSTAIEELSANILNSCFENFDQSTVENAKNRIIDVLGCLIGGANNPSSSALVDLVKDWGGKAEATILIHGGKAPAHNVAMVNSIMARSFDFEVLFPLVEGVTIPNHVSGTTVMTAITMGEVMHIDGKELITALLVGDDVAARIQAASASGFDLAPGFDYIGTVNVFGAAAIAGRLLGLNELQMRNAFGIALNQLAGTFQSVWDGTTCFKLLQGTSARNGIFSTQLAKRGWTGPEDALSSKFGYYHLYTLNCNPEILTKNLGQKYYAEATFKPYPCCRLNHGAIDCALAIVRKHKFNAEDIEEITLEVTPRGRDSFVGQQFRIRDFPQGDAIFSLRYNVANALIRKGCKPEHFSEEAISDPQVNKLAQAIKLSPTIPPEKGPVATNLRVRLTDSRELSEYTEVPKGDPVKNPMSNDEIKAKFMDNVDFSHTMTKENAEKLLRLLERLEELDNVDKIVELLVV